MFRMEKKKFPTLLNKMDLDLDKMCMNHLYIHAFQLHAFINQTNFINFFHFY